MISQREADLAVLLSVYTRSAGERSTSRKLNRVRNSLTAGGYLTAIQFNRATEALLSLQMIELAKTKGEPSVVISDHGAAWLTANFHWLDGERATLQPNHDNWMMTPPDECASVSDVVSRPDEN